jgi:hypothetical protein
VFGGGQGAGEGGPLPVVDGDLNLVGQMTSNGFVPLGEPFKDDALVTVRSSSWASQTDQESRSRPCSLPIYRAVFSVAVPWRARLPARYKGL